jgi:intracellular sulfur oxidation DsrE/DsrF family protein
MRNAVKTMLVVGMWMMLAVSNASQADEKKIVLQISDGGEEKQTLLLNVTNNLLKAYGQENVKIEVVAFGPGLRLLFADNAHKDRVQSAAASGVRFSACQNTVAAMTQQLGHAPVLTKEAQPVPAGIVRIVELTADGYTLVRP